MNILAVINDPICDGGIVLDELARLGHAIDQRQPHHGGALPAEPEKSYDALIVFGGAMSAYDDADHPTLRDVADAIAGFTAADKPVLGICLGAQQIARAFGQPHRTLDWMEFGFTPFQVCDSAKGDPVLAGLPVPPIAQVHGDSYLPPPGSARLLSGDTCHEQAFRLGRATYGFQAHFEVSSSTLTTWFDYLNNQERQKLGPDSDARIAAFRAQIPDRLPAAQAFGREVTRRWAALAG